jgi:hypothetical protein
MAAGWTVRADTTGYRDENMKRAIFNGTQQKAIFMENTAIQREKRRNVFKIEQCIHSVFGY